MMLVQLLPLAALLGTWLCSNNPGVGWPRAKFMFYRNHVGAYGPLGGPQKDFERFRYSFDGFTLHLIGDGEPSLGEVTMNNNKLRIRLDETLTPTDGYVPMPDPEDFTCKRV